MAKGNTAASVLGHTKERIVKVRIIKKMLRTNNNVSMLSLNTHA